MATTKEGAKTTIKIMLRRREEHQIFIRPLLLSDYITKLTTTSAVVTRPFFYDILVPWLKNCIHDFPSLTKLERRVHLA